MEDIKLAVSAWWAYTEPITRILKNALAAGEIAADDIVWVGPAGDYIIADTIAELDDDCLEYEDSGTVEEFLLD